MSHDFQIAGIGRSLPIRLTSEQARRLTHEALGRLANELKSHHAALSQYLTTMGQFHTYGWENTLLIYAQRPTATRIDTERTWQQLGRSVKQGEKAIVMCVAERLREHRSLTATGE